MANLRDYTVLPVSEHNDPTWSRGKTVFDGNDVPFHSVTSTVQGRTCSCGTPIMSFESEHLQSSSRQTRYLSKVPPTVHTYSATPFDFAILPAHFSPCTVERSKTCPQRSHDSESSQACSLSFGSWARPLSWPRHGPSRGHLYRSNHITATNACLITNSQNPLVKCIRCLSWYTWLIDTSCSRTLGPSA